MLFFHLVTFLKIASAKSNIRTKFLDNLSLIPPHVGANGRGEDFEFDNHYLTKIKTRKDHTQLGYRAPESFGIVKTKENFKFKDMETSIEFTLQDLSKGGKQAGFGFWLVEKPDNQPEFYGGNRSFKGCGVILDIEGTPFFKFIDNTNVNRKGFSLSSLAKNENLKIQISNHNKRFTVKVFVSDKEHLLYEGPVPMPEKVFICATSFSGTSKCTMKLERIFSQSFLPGPKKGVARGERQGKRGIIYLIGVCSIAGLAYYLYSKERKEFVLKQ